MAKPPKMSVTGGAVGPDQHVSVSVRKIANGFIAQHSRTGPKGDYQSTETFHPKKPAISVSMPSPKMGGMKMGAAAPKVAKPRAKKPRGIPANLMGMKL